MFKGGIKGGESYLVFNHTGRVIAVNFFYGGNESWGDGPILFLGGMWGHPVGSETLPWGPASVNPYLSLRDSRVQGVPDFVGDTR